MKKILYVFALLLVACAFIGCRTHRVIETQIVHDSVYQTKDSIIVRFVKDSVSEREKTNIYTKHDTVTGIDTVFVIREKYIDRWKVRTDTIQKIVYVEKSKSSTKEVKKEKKKMSEKKQAFLFFLGCLTVWLIAYIYLRLRK